ncbi:MAG: hypothetical protein JXI43_12915 [Tissierellales bacterium]|nr:hypothetical protein [Tissierellales bacterium]
MEHFNLSFLKQHSRLYALSILLTFVVLLFFFSCDQILDINYDSSVVLEIKRKTTFFDRDSTDGLAGISISIVSGIGYDINNITKTLYLDNPPSTPYSLISAVTSFIDGKHFEGRTHHVYFHHYLPRKIYLSPIIVPQPDSLLITNLDNEKVTFTFQDSSITLEVYSNYIWTDSMYVQTWVGELFAIDSLEFINHGLLDIELR